MEENRQYIIKDDLVGKLGSEEKSLSVDGFDEVKYLQTYDLGYQYLFLRKEKEIEYICYLGPEKLEDHVEAIIEDFPKPLTYETIMNQNCNTISTISSTIANIIEYRNELEILTPFDFKWVSRHNNKLQKR